MRFQPFFLTSLLCALTGLIGLSAANAAPPSPGPVEPMTHECATDYRTRVRVDGRSHDWEDEVDTTFRVDQLIAGDFRFDWTGPNDASFLLWCRQDKDNLYFAIVGRDNIIVEPKGDKKGDRFEFWFEVEDSRIPMVMMEVPLWPAIGNGQAELTYKHGRSGKVPGAKAALSERKRGEGYFLEVSIPIKEIGGDVGFGPLKFSAVQRDWDYDGGAELEVGIGTSNVQPDAPQSLGTLYFERYFATMKQILDAEGRDENYKTPKYIWADITGDKRKEWIGVVGNKLYIAGEGIPQFSTASITFTDVDDFTPLEIQALDLDPDDDLEILFRYRTRRPAPNGNASVTQEFVMVLDVTSKGLEEVIHQEVTQSLGGSGVISSKMELRDRGNYTIVRFRRATGNLSKSDYVDLNKKGGQTYDNILAPWDSGSFINNYNYRDSWQRKVE